MKSYEGDGYYEWHESRESLMGEVQPHCFDCGVNFEDDDYYIVSEDGKHHQICEDCLKIRQEAS